MIPLREMQVMRRFIDAAARIFGERLVSAAAYGSVLTDAYAPRSSDINLLIVVRDIAAADLRAFRRHVSGFCRRRRIKPVFCTPFFVASSADSFPLEWKEIAERHEVLHGDDLFATVSVREEDVRLQVEREIKQNYLAFAHALAFDLGLADALRRSEHSLAVLLRNAAGIFPSPVVRPPRMEKPPGRRQFPTVRDIAQHLAFLENLLQLSERRAG